MSLFAAEPPKKRRRNSGQGAGGRAPKKNKKSIQSQISNAMKNVDANPDELYGLLSNVDISYSSEKLALWIAEQINLPVFKRVLVITSNWPGYRFQTFKSQVEMYLASSLRRAVVEQRIPYMNRIWEKCLVLAKEHNAIHGLISQLIRVSNPARISRRLFGHRIWVHKTRPCATFQEGTSYGKGRLNFKIVIVNRQRSTPQALVHIQGSSQQQWYDITRWIGRGRNVESIDIGSINITANDKLQVIANSSSSSSSSSSSGAAAAPVPDYVWDYATKTLTINANVGENQFRDRTDIIIREVIIKDSVTTIGDGAFWGCSSLASVTFGAGLQTIGWGAFDGCSSLASVAFPDALQTIGWAAFFRCSSLASVAFGNGLQEIGGEAFDGCSSLALVAFPGALQTIGVGAFQGCSSLASVAFPDALQSIGAGAFHGCSSLSEIKIPQSLDTSTVTGWTNLPSSVTVIVSLEIGDSEDEDEYMSGVASSSPSSSSSSSAAVVCEENAILLPKIKELFALAIKTGHLQSHIELQELCELAVKHNVADIFDFLLGKYGGMVTDGMVLRAVRAKNLDMLGKLLAYEPIDLAGSLIGATRDHFTLGVEKLLAAGAGPTILHVNIVTRNLNIELLRLFLDAKYRVDATGADSKGNTCMHYLGIASSGRNRRADVDEACELLQKAGCGLNVRNLDGKTPLEMASNTEARNVLIEAGGGGVISLSSFRELSRSINYTITLNTYDSMIIDDVVESAVRCVPCKHVFNFSSLHTWLSQKYGQIHQEAAYPEKFVHTCPFCKENVENIEFFSTESAKAWNDLESAAKKVEERSYAEIKSLEERPAYVQFMEKSAAAKAEEKRFLALAHKARKDASDAALEADNAIESERARIRDAANAAAKNFRDKQILDGLTKLKF